MEELLKVHRTHTLGVFLNADVFQFVIADLVTSEWYACSHALLEKLHKSLIDCATSIVNSTIKHTSREICRNWILNRILSLMKREFEGIQILLDQLIASECIPYTNDDSIFQDLTKKRIKKLLQQVKANATIVTNCNVKQSMVGVALIEKAFSDFENSPYNKPVYQMQDIIATYGERLVKVISDLVPKQIETQLLRRLQPAIANDLQTVEDITLEVLFAENSSIVKERKEAQEAVAKMERALEAVEGFRY